MTKFKLKIQGPSAAANDNGNEEKRARQRQLSRLRMQRYRERLRNDGPAYDALKEKDRERKKHERQQEKNLTESEKERIKEGQRIRQKRYMEKKRQEGHQKTEKRKTRAEQEKQREQWRQRKKISRDKMTAQKHRRIKEKDAAYRKKKRAKTTEQFSTPTAPENSNLDQTTSTFSSSARRKAISRVRKALPKQPNKFASVVQGLLTGASTPQKDAMSNSGLPPVTKSGIRKRLAFEKIAHTVTSKEKPGEGNENKRKVKRAVAVSMAKLKKYRLMRTASRITGMQWSYLMKYTKRKNIDRKERSDKIDNNLKSKISTFYAQPQISTIVPDTSLYTKKSQPDTPIHIMNSTVEDAFREFQQQNPGDKIGLSAFAHHRPTSVLTMSSKKHIQCLCEYCANIDELLKSVNKQCDKLACPQFKVKEKHTLLKMTLCPKGDAPYHRPQCYSRSCDLCGVHTIREHFGEAIDLSKDEMVTGFQWVNEQIEIRGKMSTRKVYRARSGCLAEMVDQLCDILSPFAQHMFVAYWQQSVFSQLKESISANHVLSVIDFSENFATFYQNAIQATHWVNNQATLFPMVSWYPCTTCEGHEIIRESIVIISDDLKHDANAVHKFQQVAYEHIKERRSINIERAIEFSDGASSQFKSRMPFCDLSHSNSDFGFPIERNFFGSRHGKNDSDGVSGIVKRILRCAILSDRAVITSAFDMHAYLEENYTKPATDAQGRCLHIRRHFIYVSSLEINRDRPTRMPNKCVSGTRKFHSVKPKEPGIILSRQLSCYCNSCYQNGTPIECTNAQYTDAWSEHSLHFPRRRHRQDPAAQNDPEIAAEDPRDALPGPEAAVIQPTLVPPTSLISSAAGDTTSIRVEFEDEDLSDDAMVS